MSSGHVQRRPDEGAQGTDVGALVAGGAVRFAKRHKVLTSAYLVGMVAAIGFGGFAVEQSVAAQYDEIMRHAEHVTHDELAKAESHFGQADSAHYNAKGWFWSCDATCQRLKQKRDAAENRVMMVRAKRDEIIKEARSQVGVWSSYSVREVRAAFWRAWEAGKALAARWTMYDAMFMAMGSGRRREDGLAEVLLKLFLQYLSNLTIGLIGSFVYFVYEVYRLVFTYGPSMVSGFLFFALASCAGLAMVSTFLGGIFGAVGGGLYYVAKQAQENQARLQRDPQYRARMQNQAHRGHQHYE